MTIKQEMFLGVIWSAVEKFSGIALSIIISGILARLISPNDFGIIAVATVLINFFEIFTGLGLGPAIIQRNDLTEKNLDSIFTFTILIGLILAIGFYSSAEFIASWYQNNSLKGVCRILSFNLFFAALNIVPLARMTKDKKFKLMAKRSLLLQGCGGVISIFGAYNSLGLYSLLISPLFSAVGMFVFNFRYYPCKVDYRLDTQPLKLVFSFSIYQFLFTFLNYFSRNLDKLIIGKFFSLKELGYYEKSYRLMMLPLQNVTHVVTPVMQPVLSVFQDDKQKLAEKYNIIIKFIAAISFPISTFLFFAADDMIRIVYGATWDAAIPVFKILALSLSVQMILSTSGAIYQSANATKWMFYNGISNTITTVSGFGIASVYFKTIEAMAWAWDITIFLNLFVSYFIMYKVVLNSPLLEMLKLLIIPLFASLASGCVVYFFNYFFVLSIIISVLSKFILVTTMYVAILQITNYYDLLGILNSKLNSHEINSK